MSPGHKLGDQLSNAMAFLHCELLGQNVTKEFLYRKNHCITHIFDTDVIIAFMRPFTMGPAPHDREPTEDLRMGPRGYGQLLPRQPVDSQKNMVRIRAEENGIAWHTTTLLIETCFEIARGTTGRILQFPQHKQQTEMIQHNVERNATQQRKTGSKTSAEIQYHRNTEVIATSLLEAGRSTDELIEFLATRLEGSFLEFYDGRRAAEREYQNFLEFDRRFDGVHAFNEKVLHDKFGALYEFDDEFLRVENAAVRILDKFWHRRLKRSNPSRTSKNLKDDVDALNDLARINRRLIFNYNEMPHRVVFVTGDRSLIEATYDISRWELKREIDSYLNVKFSEGELSGKDVVQFERLLDEYFGIHQERPVNTSIRGWFESFAHHYIRHFWAVAGDALIDPNSSIFKTEIVPSGGGKTRTSEQIVQDFFHGYFAVVGERLHLSRRNMEKRVLRKKPANPRLAAEVDVGSVLRDWRRLTRGRIESRRLSGLDKEEFSNTLRNHNDKNNLLEVFEKLAERQRDRAMVELSDYGAAALFQCAKNVSTPPDLYFKTLRNTNRLFERLANPRYYQTGVQNFMNDFAKIKLDCFGWNKSRDEKFDDRQISHLKFLVLGAAFGANEKWAAAYGHTLRAINIIERSRGGREAFNGPILVKATTNTAERSHMSGREAYYLAAICMRMRAENTIDFDQCRWFLEKAGNALKADKEARENLDLTFHTTRLDNERWSLSLAEYFYARSMDEKKDVSVFAKPVYEHSKNIEFFKLLMLHLENTEKQERQLTCDALCFNILQTFIIASFREDLEVDHQKALAERALEWLNKRATEREHYAEPDLVRFYRLATPLGHFDGYPKFNTGEDIRIALANLLGGTIDEGYSVRNPSRARYDRWRIKKLGDYALKRV
jgi:hypothetical protein